MHGDPHLGQVLCSESWLLIDLKACRASRWTNGERRICAARRRCVAIVRARRWAARTRPPTTDCAREWVERNRAAFCDGYAVVGNRPGRLALLLGAYELDKARWRPACETRHRPGFRFRCV